METTDILLFDNSCPLCTAYSAAFEKNGYLGKGGACALQNTSASVLTSRVDPTRGRHEIPLLCVDGQTRYGLDALLYILNKKHPGLIRLARSPFIFFFLRQLYALISFNRRIFIPVKKGRDTFGPDFSLSQRVRLIATSILLSACITWSFGHYAGPLFVSAHAGNEMLLIAGTGWVLQFLSAFLFLRGQLRVDYLAHLSVTMLVGVFILLPAILLMAAGVDHYAVPVISVVLSSTLMLRQHHKRVQALALSNLWTITWFLFLQVTAVLWALYFLYK